MAKIENDKYYTSDELAKYCVEKTKEIIGEENITEWLEPSAGAGVFLNHLPGNVLAYDLYPEDDRIVKQDYLELELEYKEGRCIIGNPPYGSKHMTAFKFFKRSINVGDYISFILPISQYKNDSQFYDFDLVYSEDLGKRMYSGKEVWCCLNIYRIPSNGLFNKKPSYDFKKDLEMRVYLRGRESSYNITKKENFDYDIRFCTFGMAGKECKYEGQFVKEICVKINNDKYKNDVLNILRNTKWEDIYPKTTNSFNLAKWQIYKYIKEQIPEIE